MKAIIGTLAVVLTLVFFTYFGSVIYRGIVFDIGCRDRMKRAADANTVDLATKEMEALISYVEKEGLTQGYTSIEFRYNNLKASLQELKAVKPDATQLEKSNILMKLRETLLDSGKISLYPHNIAYAVWGWTNLILFILAMLSWIWLVVAWNRGNW